LGLGNPGARYRSTRHNIGFAVVDHLAQGRGVAFRLDPELGNKAWTTELETPAGRLILAKPRTYMNRSGRAAVALCRHHAVEPSQLLVVYDDADLELGRLRLRRAGSAGGHNGLVSLIESLRTEEIPRLRLGVRGAGREAAELSEYVLQPFEPAEREAALALVERAGAAVETVIALGFEAAMNDYNAPPR
jgi:PTH1 family peptidyl-tRNA hydrolase